jgi:hypothetical protein
VVSGDEPTVAGRLLPAGAGDEPRAAGWLLLADAGCFSLTTSAFAEKTIGAISRRQVTEPLCPSVRPGTNLPAARCPSKSSLASSRATSSRTFRALKRVLDTNRLIADASKAAMASATSASASENPAVPFCLLCLDNIDIPASYLTRAPRRTPPRSVSSGTVRPDDPYCGPFSFEKAGAV